MRGVNKAIIVGNVGGDPELRHMADGTAVCTLSVATADQWKDKQTGERKERTEWHRCVFWGKLAEIAGEYVRKGSPIYVEGKLQTRDYEKDGVKRYITEIRVSELTLLPSANGGSGGSGQREQAAQQQAARERAAEESKQDDFDDDLPF